MMMMTATTASVMTNVMAVTAETAMTMEKYYGGQLCSDGRLCFGGQQQWQDIEMGANTKGDGCGTMTTALAEWGRADG